ncbi:MAG: DUF1015 family protein [Clostridium sp.]|nr:DUF1015 family protein [Clostridium sp.]MCM1398039.1 DUF1015 family protein [Clostridium sp.]MCM1459325.1 DUF1015 family protein [Bacteroides sp.]
MATIKPFLAFRPGKDIVDKVAALPYDVYNREEAKEVVRNNPLSFLRIDRAETAFDDSVDTYAPCVYAKAKELLDDMISKQEYIQDEKPMYYIYELIMDGRSQTGIVACASIDDYINGVIKKHENTRADKEQDRITHVDTCNAQTGPIFLAYRAQASIDNIVNKIKSEEPEYSFVSEDKIVHNVWLVTEDEDIKQIETAFSDMSQIYIADGHHRAASAIKVGLKRRGEAVVCDDHAEYNFFLSVLFPDNQLKILPYNRVVSDLNGYNRDEFIEKISSSFQVEKVGQPFLPNEKCTFGMYLEGSWYKLTANDGIKSKDPVAGLDVSILQDYLLCPVLGIEDPRVDRRIDFVGGIRGLDELERRADSDMKVAFSMYPTSIKELFDVADAGMLMPPKSTWFEPKLRSGIFIHKL